MESSGRGGNNNGTTGRGPQLLHSRRREPVGGLRPSPKKATLAAIAVLVACRFAPELSNIHPNDDTAWTIYLTAKEGSQAMLCLLIAWCSADHLVRRMAASIAVLFIATGANEAMGKGLFAENVWQYPVAFVFLLICYLLARRSNEQHQ